ncbi:DUF4097 family beta strand repeat-containing protein [Flavilitoribacter nigricans]|uniref:DUF4097 domain-containing protein n=1 Tax=Flavilitoribacter nigricans (strain ATCC 23147 / DSM 23189 / NBRC 102662 / NCIMB 1420 / SS-2) TaxID=1122177 RepID=A0A2D0NDN3_FLAN2|nr:DUF4097 family beta strand repeat-containing protein [Flavilitoribacter nigricans]PHN06621.1 hypothetical protein CRP01_09990 [Flavilitoribacter nigricans DSM 23189 = NBRC 102662]
MKRSPIVLGFLLACFALQAQNINKAFSSSGTITIILDNADLKVEAYSGTEVQIESSGYSGPPERAKGLKALSARGQDNTGIGLEIMTSGGAMTIKKSTGQSVDYRIKVPVKANLKIEEDGWGGSGDYYIKGSMGEIEIKTTNSDIVLEDISGPVVAKTTSGDITVTFANMNGDKPTSIVNTSGFIDVTMPTSIKADLKLRSISGEIFSDLDLEFPDTEFKNRYSSNFDGKLNGGGAEIDLRAISGNIYLRKK